jgi:hypothetical protein
MSGIHDLTFLSSIYPEIGIIFIFPGRPIHPGQDSNKCLTAPSNVDGGKVVIYSDCIKNDKCIHLSLYLCSLRFSTQIALQSAQSWSVGTYTRVYGDKCLDVTNGGTSNGVRMQIWSCAPGNKNQKWIYDNDKRFIWNNGGSVQECLDLTNGNENNGTPVRHSHSCRLRVLTAECLPLNSDSNVEMWDGKRQSGQLEYYSLAVHSEAKSRRSTRFGISGPRSSYQHMLPLRGLLSDCTTTRLYTLFDYLRYFRLLATINEYPHVVVMCLAPRAIVSTDFDSRSQTV